MTRQHKRKHGQRSAPQTSISKVDDGWRVRGPTGIERVISDRELFILWCAGMKCDDGDALSSMLKFASDRIKWLEKLSGAWTRAAYNLNAQMPEGSPMDRGLELARELDLEYGAWLKGQETQS